MHRLFFGHDDAFSWDDAMDAYDFVTSVSDIPGMFDKDEVELLVEQNASVKSNEG